MQQTNRDDTAGARVVSRILTDQAITQLQRVANDPSTPQWARDELNGLLNDLSVVLDEMGLPELEIIDTVGESAAPPRLSSEPAAC
jgi:hypothetical protein